MEIFEERFFEQDLDVSDREHTFDNLALTKTKGDLLKECIAAQKKAETCSHCRWKCGRAMRKGL